MTCHRAEVVWRGGREDLRAHTVRMADQELAASCAAERGGDPAKADPEELFVGSLAACHMLWFLDFSRRARLRVRAYADQAEGVMDDERFTEVTLRPSVGFEGEAPTREAILDLHRRAHEACFIANSVSCRVEVEPR